MDSYAERLSESVIQPPRGNRYGFSFNLVC